MTESDPLSSSNTQGVIDIKSARIKIIYGAHPLNAFTSDAASASYKATINIASHGLSGDIIGHVSARYQLGMPHVSFASISHSPISLLTDAAVSGGFADWMIVGHY